MQPRWCHTITHLTPNDHLLQFYTAKLLITWRQYPRIAAAGAGEARGLQGGNVGP
jgi:hypothetical protein